MRGDAIIAGRQARSLTPSVRMWYHFATMPNVTLRLTDEQHAELAEAAAINERSLQREIVYRLFMRIVGPAPMPATALHAFEPVRRPVESGKRSYAPDPRPSEKKAAKR